MDKENKQVRKTHAAFAAGQGVGESKATGETIKGCE